MEYRMLKVGEVIQEGDEEFRGTGTTSVWLPSRSIGNKVERVLYYRRPLPKSEEGVDYYSSDLKPVIEHLKGVQDKHTSAVDMLEKMGFDYKFGYWQPKSYKEV